jgi:cell division ATPase FtsA
MSLQTFRKLFYSLLHQFELIRAELTLLSLPGRSEQSLKSVGPRVNFAGIAEYYNEKVRADKKIRTAEQVMGVITRLVDREGVYGIQGGMSLEDEEMQVEFYFLTSYLVAHFC